MVSGAVFVPLTIRAQEVAVAKLDSRPRETRTVRHVYSSSVDLGHRSDRQTDFKFGSSSGSGSISFELLVFDRLQAADRSGSLNAMDLPRPWSGAEVRTDLDSVNGLAAVGSSPDATKTLGDSKTFAASSFGLVPRVEDLLRGGPFSPDPLWMGTTGDTDTDRGNNFEASMTAQFVLARKAQYPVTVTFPMYVAVGDEQYFFGPHFGYVTAGINVRVPLSFIPSRYGRWNAGSSADMYYYGETTREFVKSIGFQVPKLSATVNVEL